MNSAANSIADASQHTSRGSRSRYTPTHSTSAAQDMINKLDVLFNLKTKTLLMDSFDRLTPLKNLAKSVELRQSLQKVMPEIAEASAGSRLNHSDEIEAQTNEDPSEFFDEDEGSEFSMDLALPTTLDQAMELEGEVDISADKRAAKSIIRLSNAILPLISFYNASLEANASSAPLLKQSSTPTKAGKNKIALRKNKHKTTPNKTPQHHNPHTHTTPTHTINTTPNTALSSLTGAPPAPPVLAAPPLIDVQEVHSAFHALLRQVHRLESSASTQALAYSGVVQEVFEEVPPPPPALVDVLMQENNSKVYAHISSLEKQLHHVQDSKKRQYESLQAQLRASETLNTTLKKKLELVSREKEEFVQVAVDKEKQLQAAFLHLHAAQDEIKSLKGQVSRIPRTQRETLKHTTKASLQNSRYNANQFIKLTAQIDLLREELKRERQANHDTAAALSQAAHLAESKLAHSDNLVLQLQSRIANSDYFLLSGGGDEGGYGQYAEPPTLGSQDNNDNDDHDNDNDNLDDSHLFLDAQSHHSHHTTRTSNTINSSHSKSGKGGNSKHAVHDTLRSSSGVGGNSGSNVGAVGNVMGSGGNVMSSISTVSSKHSVHTAEVAPLSGVGSGAAVDGGKSGGSRGTTNVITNTTTPPRRRTPPTTPTKHTTTTPHNAHTTHTAHTSTTHTHTAHPASPQRARSHPRESVTVSPTRSSYERTLATVEQFAPSNITHTTHTTHANSTHHTHNATNTSHNINTSTNTNPTNTIPRQPWRPSTPNPSPTHIRSGYYHYVHNVDNNNNTSTTNNHTSRSRSNSPYKTLREDGFVFNPRHTHTTHNISTSTHRGRSPVRSLRGKFSAQGASWLNTTPSKHTTHHTRTTLHNTTTSSINRRSQSASPYRRYSIGTSANYSTPHLHHHHYTLPPHIPGSNVNKDLNLGRCTYCTHNLLELWTKKFDPFGPRSNRSRSLIESHDAVEQGSSPEDVDGEDDYLGDGSGSDGGNSDSGGSGDEGGVDRDSVHSRGVRSAQGSVHTSTTHLSGKGSVHSAERSVHRAHTNTSHHTTHNSVQGSVHSKHSTHSKHTTHTTPSTHSAHTTHTAPTTTLITPATSTTPPGTTHRKSHTAVKDSAGNSISYALNRSGSERDLAKPSLVKNSNTTPAAVHAGSVHDTNVNDHRPSSPPSVHFNVNLRSRSTDTAHTNHTNHSAASKRPLLRASRDYFDDMSAITEESRGVQQEHYVASVQGVHSVRTTNSVANSKMGIADTGMSPPPSSTSRGVHGSGSAPSVYNLHSSSRDGSPPRLPHLRSAESPLHGNSTTGTQRTAHTNNTTNTTTNHTAHTAHTAHTNNTTPHSSSDTLHSAQQNQLLLHLADRDLYYKPYTTADARHLTPTEVTTQYNTLVASYNDVLTTLGKEILAIEGVKTEYKSEITESVNQVATLQTLLHALQAENDTLINTIHTYEQEKSEMVSKHEALVYSMQDELLQCRGEYEDVVEEKNHLTLQLRDAVTSYSNNNTGVSVAVGYSGSTSGTSSRRASFDQTVHTTNTNHTHNTHNTHSTHSSITPNSIVQNNTAFNSSPRNTPSRSASRDVDTTRGVQVGSGSGSVHGSGGASTVAGSVHSVHSAREVMQDIGVQYSRSRSMSDGPSSSLIEQQALRVAAEERAERVETQFTLQSAELQTLHTTLSATQAQSAEISEENNRLKNELFNVEVTLADTRDKLTLSESTVHTLNKDNTTLRTTLHTTTEECSDKLDAQHQSQLAQITQLQHTIQEYTTKLHSVSEVSYMQQQLLTQKDVQIQQIKDAHYTQQALCSALQLQLQEVSSSKENVQTNNTSAGAGASAGMEQELASAKQRLLEAETIASIQTQLLLQKDYQITQLKEDSRVQREEVALLQQRAEAERGSGGGSGGYVGLSVSHPANVSSGSVLGSSSGSVIGGGSVGYQSATHPTAATLTNINTAHTNTTHTTTARTPHTMTSASVAKIESLRQQLDATFRELEQAKRGGVGSVTGSGSGSGSVVGNRAAVHYNTSASSNNTPVSSRSAYNNSTYSVPHTPHTIHTAHTNHTTPASPLSVHSAYSTVTGTSNNTHNTHNTNNFNYVGDLQYISNLSAIQEESTVRTGTSSGVNNTIDQNTVNNSVGGTYNTHTTPNTHHTTITPQHSNTSVHNSVHSVYNNSVYSGAYINILPGIAESSVHNDSTSNNVNSGSVSQSVGGHGNGGVSGNGSASDNGSVQGTNSVQGTPLHTMLGGMYNMQQQEQTQQQAHAELQQQLHSTTAQLQHTLHTLHSLQSHHEDHASAQAHAQAHIDGLTNTNVTLSARCTQLEERLRHSELRCKLLMDQIKSMPVSLSVAQAEKRVIEAKLEKATATYTANLKKVSDGTAKKIHELSAYLQLERSERAKLESSLTEHKATIHQLSHHIQILRAQAQADVYGDGGSVRGSGGMGGNSGGNGGGGVEYTHTYSSAAHTGNVLNDTHNMANSYIDNMHNTQNMHDTHASVENRQGAQNMQSAYSRTVPLTPMSVKVPLHHTFTPGTHKHSLFSNSGNVNSNGTIGGTGGSLPYATNYLAQQVQNSNNTVNIIRASIPPAPWEDA